MSLEGLAPELLKKIFSFLSVTDLKNVRVVSTRMDRAVLNLEKIFKTWKIKISKSEGLSQNIDIYKVLQNRIKFEVCIVDNIRKLDSWLVTHSSCITRVKIESGRLSHNVIDSFGELKQVKELELENLSKDAVKTLLSSFGPRLETLAVRDRFNMSMNLPNKFLGKSLTRLHLSNIEPIGPEPDFSLPNLTKLEVNHVEVGACNWLPQLITACSRSLTELILYELSCNLDQLTCNLPALNKLLISSCQIDVNHLLSKCSASLQNLFLKGMDVALEVYVPNLKDVLFVYCTIEGFTKLAPPEESSIEQIGHKGVTGSFQNDIVNNYNRYEKLHALYTIQPLEVIYFRRY